MTDDDSEPKYHVHGVLDDLPLRPDTEPSNRLTEQEAFDLTAAGRAKYGPTHPLNTPPPPPLGEDATAEEYAAHFNRRK